MTPKYIFIVQGRLYNADNRSYIVIASNIEEAARDSLLTALVSEIFAITRGDRIDLLNGEKL